MTRLRSGLLGLRQAMLAVALGMALGAAGCGDNGDDSADQGVGIGLGGGDNAASSGPQQDEATYRPRCPARVTTAAQGSLAYDIVGVRPQMTYDEAANVILCANRGMALRPEQRNAWNINTQGLTVRHGFLIETPETPAETEARLARYRGGDFSDSGELAPGKQRYTVTTVGAPGEERVITITSEQAFAEGSYPSVDQLRSALVEKYGEPTIERKDSGHRPTTRIIWGRDEQGRPFAAGSARGDSCFVFSTNLTLRPECGTAITAEIKPPATNDALASSMIVMSTMPGWANEYIGDAERAIAAGAQQQRSQEVEKAKASGEAPKL